MEVPIPDFALHPPPLCEAISEVDYVRFIEKADEQVCLSVCRLAYINHCNAIKLRYFLYWLIADSGGSRISKLNGRGQGRAAYRRVDRGAEGEGTPWRCAVPLPGKKLEFRSQMFDLCFILGSFSSSVS